MGFLTQSTFGGQPGTMLGNGRGNYGQYTLDALMQGQSLSPEGKPFAPATLPGQPQMGLEQPQTGLVPPVASKGPATLPGQPVENAHPRFQSGQWLDRFMGMSPMAGPMGYAIRMGRQNGRNPNYLGNLAPPNG